LIALWTAIALASPCDTWLASQAQDDPTRLHQVRCGADTLPNASPFRELAALHQAEQAEGDAALALLEGIDLPSTYGDRVKEVRANAYFKTGRFQKAAETAPADSALRVEALLRAKSPQAKAAALRFWERAVLRVDVEKSVSFLKELGIDPSDTTSTDGRSRTRARIAALKEARAHGQAWTLLKPLEKAHPTHSRVQLAGYAFRARDYASARELYASALGAPTEARGSAQALHDYGLTCARLNDYEAAAEVYNRLDEQHPASKQADTGRYKIGFMLFDRGQCSDARIAFRAYRRPGKGSYRESAGWFGAWCAFEQGDVDAARDMWETLAKGTGAIASGSAYWLARTGPQREADLQRFVSEHPDTMWAWFASDELGLRYTVAKTSETPKLPTGGKIAQASVLAEHGFLEDARRYFVAYAPKTPSGRGEALQYAQLGVETGAWKKAMRLARPYCDDVPQLCVPKPMADIVGPAAAAHMPEYLPYAIMQVESALDPSVTSHAGARGLMQIMPAEVPRLHRDAGLPGEPDPDRLYDPAYNVALGVAELRHALAAFPEAGATQLPAAIASYNAGTNPVRKWVTASANEAEFADRIPWTETRRYVRSVMGYLMRYRRVWGDTSE